MLEPPPKVNGGTAAAVSPAPPPKVNPEAGFASPLAVVAAAELFPKLKFGFLASEELCPNVNVDGFDASVASLLSLLPKVNPEVVLDFEAPFPPKVKPLEGAFVVPKENPVWFCPEKKVVLTCWLLKARQNESFLSKSKLNIRNSYTEEIFGEQRLIVGVLYSHWFYSTNSNLFRKFTIIITIHIVSLQNFRKF